MGDLHEVTKKLWAELESSDCSRGELYLISSNPLVIGANMARHALFEAPLLFPHLKTISKCARVWPQLLSTHTRLSLLPPIKLTRAGAIVPSAGL